MVHRMVSLNEYDTAYGVMPYFHAGGLLTVFTQLSQGVKTIINHKFDANTFLTHILEYNVTTLNIVPPILSFLCDACETIVKEKWPIKKIFVGAAKVEYKLVEDLKAKFAVDIIELYGSTEAGLMIFMHPVSMKIKEGSCGIPLPGVQCKIIDIEKNEPCEALRPGELWIKSSTMMQQHQDPANDGFFYICGRLKDMMKVRGWQVSPYELEEVILGLSGVKECAVIGQPDLRSGQLPKAFISLKNGAELSKDVVHAAINDKFISYKHLEGGIEFVDEFPKTPTGKIARHKMIKQ